MRFRPIASFRFLWDLVLELAKDQVGLISAGIAFYGLLSLFPGIAAIMALGGLMTQPQVLVEQMRQIGTVLPPDASKIIVDQAVQIAGSQSGGLGLAAAVGITISIYSASRAVGSLIAGIHVAANRTDDRGIFSSLVFNLAMTVMMLLLALVAILSVVVIPAILALLNASGLLVFGIGLVRWPIMGAITVVGLGLLYRLSIRGRRSAARWISPGAVVAGGLWLVGSVIFSIYVRNFAHYNQTFGTLGGVVSLLMWMWLSAYIVLLGEEVNSLIASRSGKVRGGKITPEGRLGGRKEAPAPSGQAASVPASPRPERPEQELPEQELPESERPAQEPGEDKPDDHGRDDDAPRERPAAERSNTETVT